MVWKSTTTCQFLFELVLEMSESWDTLKIVIQQQLNANGFSYQGSNDDEKYKFLVFFSAFCQSQSGNFTVTFMAFMLICAENQFIDTKKGVSEECLNCSIVYLCTICICVSSHNNWNHVVSENIWFYSI